MKKITKGTEPSEFTAWKSEDKMAHRPNWKRLRAPLKTIIHESLMSEQGYICCYCESRIGPAGVVPHLHQPVLEVEVPPRVGYESLFEPLRYRFVGPAAQHVFGKVQEVGRQHPA